MGTAVDRLIAKLAGPADEARDDHGRWTSGGAATQVSTQMTERAADVAAVRSGSQYPQPLYHVTYTDSANQIAQNGFRNGAIASGRNAGRTTAGVYGCGIYFNTDQNNNLAYTQFMTKDAEHGGLSQVECRYIGTSPILKLDGVYEDGQNSGNLGGLIDRRAPADVQAALVATRADSAAADQAALAKIEAKIGPPPPGGKTGHIVYYDSANSMFNKMRGGVDPVSGIDHGRRAYYGNADERHEDALTTEAVQRAGYGGVEVRNLSNKDAVGGTQVVIFNPSDIAVVKASPVPWKPGAYVKVH